MLVLHAMEFEPFVLFVWLAGWVRGPELFKEDRASTKRWFWREKNKKLRMRNVKWNIRSTDEIHLSPVASC